MIGLYIGGVVAVVFIVLGLLAYFEKDDTEGECQDRW
jgi:hypothetical protein